MGLGIGLGLGQNSRNPVGSFLAGTKGGLIDFRDRSRLFQDAAGTTPVTANGQPIGLAGSVGPVVPFTFSQATAGAFPTSATAGAAFDGGDWLDGGINARLVFRNVEQAFVGVRFSVDTLASVNAIMGFATNLGFARLVLSVLTTGAISANIRRLDPESPVTVTSSAGLVSVGVVYDAGLLVNYTTGSISIRLNASEVATGITTSSGGPSSDTTSVPGRIGRGIENPSPTGFLAGSISYVLLANKLPTVAEWNTIRARLA
jgi:hypothetical protein